MTKPMGSGPVGAGSIARPACMVGAGSIARAAGGNGKEVRLVVA